MLRLLGVFVAPPLLAVSLLAVPPEWLLNAAKLPVPALPAGTPAIVLLDETVQSVLPDGAETIVHRYAVRLLNGSGHEHASGGVTYTDKEDKVEVATAWLIRGGKEVRPPQRRDWVDVSTAGAGVVFSEARARVVSYADLALDGDVFGYETRTSGRLQFAEAMHEWSSVLPSLATRFTLRLPPDWRGEPSLSGPNEAAIICSGGAPRWTWELSSQPYRPQEPAAAGLARLDAWLYVRLTPPANVGTATRVSSWADLRDWSLRLQEGQCDTGPVLAAKVRELTAGCGDTLSKLRALSRHVQNLRYVAIDRDLAKGYGCRPRKATEVLARGWGDCKDKSNLLRAMLREAGIESFMTIARVSGGEAVNEAWPSAWQFNHAILAIRVGAGIDLPAVVDTSTWGRLLFFDATAPDVLLGDLPGSLQGSKVFLLAPESEALVTLPDLPVETCHLLTRKVTLELGPGGSIAGDCSYGGPGSAGAYYRYRVRTTTGKDLRTSVTERLGTTVRGALLREFSTSDDPVSGECRFQCQFAAAGYAQLMPGGLTVIRLDVLNRDAAPAFPAVERTLPVGLDPLLHRDEVTLRLPPGIVPEELPDRCSLSSPYGSYESTYEVVDGSIIARRTLRLPKKIVPVTEYAALRRFFQEVAKADHASVVLRRSEAPPAASAPAAP
ncbi:MAG TPA: transglutaminase domain-containing protein [Opitutaceae bacterium]|nr:transglutaminase domain-containing protein [Opitutaceae bacterium]